MLSSITFLDGSNWKTVWSGRLSWSVAIMTAVKRSSYMLASSSGLVELSDVSSAASESCFLASAAAALRAYKKPLINDKRKTLTSNNLWKDLQRCRNKKRISMRLKLLAILFVFNLLLPHIRGLFHCLW